MKLKFSKKAELRLCVREIPLMLLHQLSALHAWTSILFFSYQVKGNFHYEADLSNRSGHHGLMSSYM